MEFQQFKRGFMYVPPPPAPRPGTGSGMGRKKKTGTKPATTTSASGSQQQQPEETAPPPPPPPQQPSTTSPRSPEPLSTTSSTPFSTSLSKALRRDSSTKAEKTSRPPLHRPATSSATSRIAATSELLRQYYPSSSSSTTNTTTTNTKRHSRASSASQTSRSSHETISSNPSSAHTNRPATALALGKASSPLQPLDSPAPAEEPPPGLSTSHGSATGSSSGGAGHGLGLQRASTWASKPDSSAASLYSVASRQTTSGKSAAASRPRHQAPPNTLALGAADLKYVSQQGEMEVSKASLGMSAATASSGSKKASSSLSYPPADSASSVSNQTLLSTPTVNSTDNSATSESYPKPFVVRNGRTYYNDPDVPYPLPADLTEMHRQIMQTLLLIQVHGAPICSPVVKNKPPRKVLELGCGSGFWSMMCHRYFKGRGHGGISFTGVDVAPVAPGSSTRGESGVRPDPDMDWAFVRHDIRKPWPFADGEFDLVMAKDLTWAMVLTKIPFIMEEIIRVLAPGGTLEVWEYDHTIRMLRHHVPMSGPNGEDTLEQEAASDLGAYLMNANTPLSPPQNQFLQEYNTWLSRGLEARSLTPVPCTFLGPTLLQETETLTDIRSRRLAIPLSEVRWEREGVGGVVTKGDGKSYVETKGKGGPHQRVEKKTLTAGQAALRRTALSTVVQEVQALEPMLRDVSGKNLDEWDAWYGKMVADLMGANGTSWGECMEIGAWWATRLKT